MVSLTNGVFKATLIVTKCSKEERRMKVGIRLKKFVAVALAAALTFSVAPVMTTEATEVAQHQTWVSQGNGWHYLQGTDIKVQIANDIIHFTGTGEVPDFDYWYLYERPWATSNCTNVIIDESITSLGKYTFYKMDKIKHVYMSTKTFIKDQTVFEGIAYKPVFRITDAGETVSMIGTIPYTSYDSIKAFAQVNSMGAAYILNNKKIALEFQHCVNPTISNVYWADDETAPWSNVDVEGNGNIITPICKITSPNVDPAIGVSAQRRYQGIPCYEAYAAFIGDYTFATTFNVVVQRAKEKIYKTDTTLQYTLTIPPQFRSASRSFRLLQIGEGVVNIFDDMDSNPETITFITDTPTTSYALVYK